GSDARKRSRLNLQGGSNRAVTVFSPTRITLEYNEKFRPQPDRENAFAGASGGAEGTGGERSLAPKILLLNVLILVRTVIRFNRDWQRN
ncbi:hypothetical protein, partial [Nioella halotolerans]|uniref:hypothetical protein n=1 Tax=Nioella halotolerans TaxID=2303578 RepID=UPI003F654EC6